MGEIERLKEFKDKPKLKPGQMDAKQDENAESPQAHHPGPKRPKTG